MTFKAIDWPLVETRSAWKEWAQGSDMKRIFVFGSNLAGRHGAGSAKAAREIHGAKYGVGVGPTGNAYALPTKDANLKILPLSTIEKYVTDFIIYARQNPQLAFDVVAIGCGLAGFKPSQIAPMFKFSPANVYLPDVFIDELVKINGLDADNPLINFLK